MEITDDETFCVEEYNTIKEYIEEKDFINITPDDWKEIEARGYDKELLIDSYFRYIPTKKKLNMAKQIWDELADVPTIDAEYDLITDIDFKCWDKGTAIIGIWHDIENWFDVSIAVDLMGMQKKDNTMESTNNRNLTPDMVFDNENNHPMVSNGTCLNFWTTSAEYDVFVIYHELEIKQYEDVVEKVVRYIMDHRKINDTKKQLAEKIHNILEALIDWEYNTPYIIVDDMKTERK